MRANLTLRILGAVTLAMLAGCATNSLRVQQAAEVAQKGRAVAAASHMFLVQVETARYAANVDLIAADPLCYRDRAQGRTEPDIAGVQDAANPPAGWLCEQLPEARRGRGLDLAPLGPALAPTIQLIEALTAYSAAICEILEARRPDPAGDLQNAYATATAAQGLLHALSSSVPAPAPDPRVGALAAFIGFLAELRNEADAVGQLRRLRDGGAVGGALIASLDDHLETWETARAETERQNVGLAEALLAAATSNRARLNAVQRRAFAQSYYQRVLAAADSGLVHRALKAALTALSDAEASYQALLRDNPQLTPGQRRRQAAIIRQRLTRGLELAAAMITAFRA